MSASGPVSESQRLALMHRLCEMLGVEEGRTLMESLPAVHWHDLATKDDVLLLKGDVLLLKDDVSLLKDDVSLLKDAVLLLKDAIDANKTAIEANKAAIEANRTAIEANRTAIEANRAAIEASEHLLRTEMSAEFKMLRAEHKELQGAMALQLAKQTRTIVFTMLAFAMPTWGSILALGLM
ncbi:MAG: alanine-zipper protein [Acidimicrobiaceae bacterium]|nr:alanine-zipper protein [Acidimicrobiaceae bacterium]